MRRTKRVAAQRRDFQGPMDEAFSIDDGAPVDTTTEENGDVGHIPY